MFVALLLISATISMHLTRLRTKNFGERLASSVIILAQRARDHDVEVIVSLPEGNYSLKFFGNGSALFSMNGQRFILNGFPDGFEGEAIGGSSLTITSDGRVIPGG